MTTPTAVRFTKDAYAFLVGLDSSTLKEEHIGDCRRTLGDLRREGAQLMGTLPELGTALSIREAVTAFTLALPDEAEVAGDKEAWLIVREELEPLYEAMATALKREERAPVKHLHPTNYARSLFHVSSGVILMILVHHVLTQSQAVTIALIIVCGAWTTEYARLRVSWFNDMCMWVFGPVAREHEWYRVNSATWYSTAALLLSATAFGMPGVLGLLTLAVGDPLAGLVGRRFGTYRLPGGKSLEGAVAFVVSSLLVGLFYLAFYFPDLNIAQGLLLAVAAGASGAVVELMSTRWDDNFTIPVASGWTVLAVAWWFSIPW